MNALNYLRSAIPDCLKLAEQCKLVSQEYANKIPVLLAAAKIAPKFILPENGRIFNNTLRALPDDFRLPYPQILIEYSCRRDGGLAEDTFGKDSTVPSPERIVIACETPEKTIMVASIVCMHSKAGKYWVLQPYAAELVQRNRLDQPELARYAQFPEITVTGSVKQVAVLLYDIGGMAFHNCGSDWLSHASVNMNDENNAVLELIEALSCSNVSHEPLPVRKQNKSASKRGALPFDEYRVLTVRNAITAKDGSTTILQIDRRSPREHLRRGHVRNLQDGRRIWINSMLINVNAGARITKDYKMVAA